MMIVPAMRLVDNIVFQDQQANAELAKIMGEFTEAAGDQSPSPTSKGDDLLAMMDGL